MPTKPRLTLPRTLELEEPKVLAAARVSGGMITVVDPADIPNEALVSAKNARVRFDKTSRRSGHVLFTPVKPNSIPVIGLALFKRNNGDKFLLRFASDGVTRTVHYTNLTTWTALTGTMSGGQKDLISTAVIEDNFVFATNGKDKLKKVDLALNTFSDLGTLAPQARFVTGFFNRVVAANYQGGTPNPVNVGWSGDRNFSQWDPAVDNSAGSTPLVESPADLADHITGVFGFTSTLVILRELSLWLATKQPSASNPFYFYAAVPGIGCGAPYSAAVIPGGIAFLDTRKGTVWAYGIGGTPEPIGRAVENEILRNLDDPNIIQGSYGALHDEYTVSIPVVGVGFKKNWTYSFRTKAWSFDEVENIETAIADVDALVSVSTIDSLSGTIDQLTGTIDSLGTPSVVISSTKFLGKTNGDILQEDANAINDAGVTFTTELQSKDFSAPDVDVYFAQIRIDFQFTISGTITLDYSKDGGKTWKTAKSKTITDLGVSKVLRYTRNIRARRLRWRLVASNGSFDLLGYVISAYPSGQSRT